MCQEQLHLKQVRFQDLNGLIARILRTLLLPAQTILPQDGPLFSLFEGVPSVARLGTPLSLAELIQRACPDPSMKLLTVQSLPQVSTVGYFVYLYLNLCQDFFARCVV